MLVLATRLTSCGKLEIKESVFFFVRKWLIWFVGFGNTATSTAGALFGGQQQQPQQQQAAGIFGAAQQNKPLFGTQTNTSTASAGFGGFGANTGTTSLFGQNQQPKVCPLHCIKHYTDHYLYRSVQNGMYHKISCVFSTKVNAFEIYLFTHELSIKMENLMKYCMLLKILEDLLFLF